jgi:hypothetical protein
MRCLEVATPFLNNLIICDPATREQINQMCEVFRENLIKLAVDVYREILAGCGELLRKRIEHITRLLLEVA